MPLVLSLAAIVAKISSIAEELLAHVALAAGVIDGLSAKVTCLPEECGTRLIVCADKQEASSLTCSRA